MEPKASLLVSFALAPSKNQMCKMECWNGTVYKFSVYLYYLSDVGKGSLAMSVLSESPSSTLGQLIFEKGVHPQRLEGLMGDFPHLRIVEVLIKCCCPQLSSLASPMGGGEEGEEGVEREGSVGRGGGGGVKRWGGGK